MFFHNEIDFLEREIKIVGLQKPELYWFYFGSSSKMEVYNKHSVPCDDLRI